MEEVKYRLLGPEFYLQEDVVGLARELLGKLLMTRISGTVTGGMISETEAYRGIVDRASHSFGGRKTKRTSTMYREGGIAYVYLCYGIHSLFNVVTNKMDIPDAVLIRGIFPVEGLTEMGKRIGREVKGVIPVSGPGLVSKALGITTLHNGLPLMGPTDGMEPAIWIAEGAVHVADGNVLQTKRIGVEYSGEDALLPYRFLYKPDP